MNWRELTSLAQLDEIIAQSKIQPVLIFKHSTRCSISAASLSRLERKWDGDKAQKLETFFIDLIANRDVSNEISSRFGVMHQSPQALLIQNGECVYDNSHFGISFEDIIENIKPVVA